MKKEGYSRDGRTEGGGVPSVGLCICITDTSRPQCELYSSGKRSSVTKAGVPAEQA